MSDADAGHRDALARFHWRAGRLGDAEAEARRAIELAPDNAGYHATLAPVLWQAGRRDDAAAEARRATELAPD
ncbi:MAG: tetratricopeptide repeat protein [Streptosporangiaceae bacterium]